jgi:hypothetical protein
VIGAEGEVAQATSNPTPTESCGYVLTFAGRAYLEAFTVGLEAGCRTRTAIEMAEHAFDRALLLEERAPESTAS